MQFTAKNIHHYLTDRGYLTAASVVNGNYLLSQNRSRNNIFKIQQDHQTGLFIKQLSSNEPQNVYLMQKEATALHLLHHAGLYSETAQYIPNYFGYDTECNLLVLEYFPAAKNIHEITYEEKSFSTTYAKQMAEILSSFHFDINLQIPENPSLQFFNKQIPWMLNIGDLPNIDNQNNCNPVPKFIKQFSELIYRIDRVRSSWKCTSLIHGDIKWMNFIVYGTNNQLKLVDWEIADIGDPLWDVAGVFQSYLVAWIYSFNNDHSMLQQLPGQEFILPKNMAQAINVFWGTYLKKQNYSINDSKEVLERTMAYVAVRMLQTAFEANVQFQEITANSVRLVQLSDNMLQKPIELARNLFGLKV